MKRVINFFSVAAVLSTVTVVSCNQSDYNKDTSAVTTQTATSDTMQMKIPDTTTMMPVDTAAKMAATTNTPANTTDAKRKKGKVSSVMVMKENKTAAMKMNKDGYYDNVEVLPMFPGGQSALDNFINTNIEYPEDANDHGVEGVVKVNFAVDEMGKIYNPKIMDKPLGYGLEEAVLKAVNKMPTWTPGAIKGKNVKTYYTLPVNFKLDN